MISNSFFRLLGVFSWSKSNAGEDGKVHPSACHVTNEEGTAKLEKSPFCKYHCENCVISHQSILKPLGERLMGKRLFSQSQNMSPDWLLITKEKMVTLHWASYHLIQVIKVKYCQQTRQLSLCALWCDAVTRAQLHLCSIPAKNPLLESNHEVTLRKTKIVGNFTVCTLWQQS